VSQSFRQLKVAINHHRMNWFIEQSIQKRSYTICNMNERMELIERKESMY